MVERKNKQKFRKMQQMLLNNHDNDRNAYKDAILKPDEKLTP